MPHIGKGVSSLGGPPSHGTVTVALGLQEGQACHIENVETLPSLHSNDTANNAGLASYLRGMVRNIYRQL